MDILSKLRVVFWGLVIGLWGLFMYQYINEDMSSLKKFHVAANPFTGKPDPLAIVKRTAGPVTPYLPPGPEPQAGTTTIQGSLIKPIAGPEIKDVAELGMMPEHSLKDKAGIPAIQDSAEEPYPEAPKGFATKVTRHFVIYEEGPQVSKEIADTVETLHGNIMLDLIAFSPWSREKKVYIFFAQTQGTYRRITGRPEWSGGAASLSERKIYLYKSDEAFGILAHELTHIYFDSFFTPSTPSPLWLSEGIATYIQSERGYSTPGWLKENLKRLETGSGFKLTDLVRIEDLQGADEDNVRLWYAQAYSLARFLMRMKTGESFYLFCKGLRDGAPVAQALYRAYGMPYNKLSSLEYAWRYDLKTGKISAVNR
ncbi:MAG: hypothetical protein A2234_06990 [Elusimicrobia bacterium RIFOXYA2_FULL_58_8]|nr:MAG: hypothetical protein A2234_06990 [Elusimicrobia bacterium RIFOXYA2_FULL_58_8]OGS14322.1 MAG: hypothetical protein A2285_08650 [Elusimicrobia bacterium RIFOXYA12_FULL_57_11]